MLTDLLVKNASSDKLYVEDVFSTYLYTGNGSSQTITNGINLSGKGGMVWAKNRSATGNNVIADTTRGTYSTLFTNLTNAASGSSYIDFSSTGFSVINSGSWNVNNNNFASWTFREAPKFFDVVTYTGNDTARDIAHSLGVAPGMIIIKTLNAASNWFVWHRSLNNKITFLESTDAAADATGYYFGAASTQTATTFRVLASGGNNASGNTYVAYLFAHDTTADGIVQCGSFTKDGSGNATVSLGWEPQYVLVKSTNGSNAAVGDSWLIADIMRGANYTATAWLEANASTAEGAYGGPWCVPTATGFQINGLSGGSNNIYLAIRRGPMRTPTDATKVFTPSIYTGNSGTQIVTAGFPIDLSIMANRDRSGTSLNPVFDRLRGSTQYLSTNFNDAETTANSTYSPLFDSNTSITLRGLGITNYSSATYVDWNFRRAPSFFDQVCYSGTGATLSVSHNLKVVPELIIIKRRNTAYNWPVWRTGTGTGTTFGYLNSNAAEADQGVAILTATPTSTAFSLAAWAPINGSGGTYVAYLFASCPGVSKVGTYTGSGTTKQIDCGFTNGARFVLIKRTDSVGEWFVYDSARGIIAGNDPYLALNSTSAEVTNTDYVDAYSAGFELSSTAPPDLNANGGTYIYLAIA